MRNRALLAATVIAACSIAGSARADDVPAVYAGVFLHDVVRFDLKNGTFDVDVELWAKWRGELDPDRIQIANAAEIERRFLGIESDRDWHSARWRVRGTLRGQFPLHRFPFDEQHVAVVVELPEHVGRLVPDLASSGMAESFSLTDWLYEPEFRPTAESQRFASDLGMVSHEGEPVTVHRVAYRVRMTRPIVTVALKLFLPLAIIVLVALVALFLDPEAIEPRSGIGVTALLSCFAFQFTVSDSLPEVAYVTLADTLFLIAYIISSGALITTVAIHVAHGRGRTRVALFTDRVMRALLPCGALIAVWLSVPEPEPEDVRGPDPVPVEARHASARPELRIGTTLLSSATGTPVSAGAHPSLMPEGPDGEPRPLLVERRPGVDNDALRFLASGELEVTWRLREGLAWSDGRPVSAADLLLPWRAIDNDHVLAFDAPDDRTLTVRWDGRLSQALDAPTVWPAHVLGAAFEEGEYTAVRDRMRSAPTPGLGPYRMVEFEARSHAIAEANPSYLGAAPSIARVHVRFFEEGQALVDAFLAGDVDVTAPNSVTLEQAEAVGRQRPGAAHVRPSSLLVVLHPDLDDPLLSRRPVREALLAAIDRERIAREVYGDAGRVAHVPVPGALPPGTRVIAHAPDEARAALHALGATGAPLKLLRSTSPVTLAMAELIREDLEAAGLSVVVEDVDNPLRTYNARGWGGLLLRPTQGSRDVSPRRFWNLPLVSGAYPPEARHDAYDDEVHALVERELRAMYPERRRQLRDALFALTSERLPNLPLVFAAERVLAVPALRGWDAGPDVPFGEGLESWYFAQDEAATPPPSP